MIPGVVAHLWQSTWFLGAAWLLTLVLRKTGAQVRYAVWFAASVKFLIPFSLLAGLGSLAPRHEAGRAAPTAWLATAEDIGRPVIAFPATALTANRANANYLVGAALLVWACGFLAIAICWLARWRRVRALRKSAVARGGVKCAVPVMSAAGIAEPGVIGIVRPVLLLPEGIEDRLDAAQLDAILAHELCHVRRRDNLTAAIHMFAQAVFWFHPLVWWLGTRLVDERERACDEEVLRLGGSPRVYAEAILNVCKLYVESPLACVSGVTGSNLKRRIEAIMSNRFAVRLSFAKKAALALVGTATLVVPVIVGVLNAPAIQAQSVLVERPKFEVASIKRCTQEDLPSGGGRGRSGGAGPVASDPGMFRTGCVPLGLLIQRAYIQFANGQTPPARSLTRQPLQGGPDWIDSERYTIDAKPESPQTRAMMNGPMLQTLLEERFKLKIHRESKEVPVYALVVAKGGATLAATKPGGCSPRDPQGAPMPVEPGKLLPCGYMDGGKDGLDAVGVPIVSLCQVVSSQVPRPVIDKTGLTGLFDYHLDFSPGPPGTAPGEDDPTAPDRFAMVSDALKKFGLRLEAAKGTAEFVVIDHVERPSGN